MFYVVGYIKRPKNRLNRLKSAFSGILEAWPEADPPQPPSAQGPHPPTMFNDTPTMFKDPPTMFNDSPTMFKNYPIMFKRK